MYLKSNIHSIIRYKFSGLQSKCYPSATSYYKNIATSVIFKITNTYKIFESGWMGAMALNSSYINDIYVL